MANLATAQDLEDRLGRDLTAVEQARADAALADASAKVRSYTGQFLELATTTDTVRVRRGVVVLPQVPVSGVSAVVDLNGNPISYSWDGIDRVRVGANVLDTFSFEPWRTPIATVKVTSTHGYATIPDDIVAITCSMVLRAFGVDPTQASTVQEGIGPATRTIGSIGAAGAVGLLPAEMETLNGYRRIGGWVQIGPS